ncbi:MAG TPA: IPT/TIG domain-containing protein [Steroidobacteraceae bacterium]|jgi:YD repeat-containing protein|nr:IPT/TIG domain-containing protein [Steroidobacteraceae bacterium]
MQWIAGLTFLICNLAIASPPTAPTNLTAVAASSTQINLSWTASTDNLQITGYVIERCSGTSCTNFAQVGTVASGTAYTDSGLSAATTYRYEVYGTDSTGGGPVSNIASAETMAASVASSVTYAYDALGRLLQANVAATNIVENYTYDSAGNLTSITSSPVSTLDIANFSNPVGGPGGTITIIGSGFSTTPSSNTVKFNGVTATVISATATQLVVSIPAGATSGPITVTTGSQTVTSPGTFNVIAATGAPTITSFPPSSAPGSTIVITGTGFQTSPGDNAVRINQSPAAVVSVTATTLTVVVPPSGNAGYFNVSAGPITVTTPFGTVSSSTSFVTTGVALSSLGTISVGGSPVTISTVSGGGTTYFAELLSGTAGSNLVIKGAGGAITLTVSVIAPNGSMLIYDSTLGTSGGDIQVPTLPLSGTYVVLVSAGGTTGSASYSLVGNVANTLTLNGTPTTVTLSTPGQSAVLTFAGTQGGYDSLAFSNVTLTGATALVSNPDGTTLTSISLTTTGATLLPQLSQTGTYTVTVVPKGTLTGAFTAALTSTSAATLTINGAPYNVTLNGTTPATVTFDGAVGQYLTLAFQTTASFYLTATVTGPNANQIVQSSQEISSTSPAGINLGPLTVAGTYSLTLQQNVSTNSTLAVTLSAPVTGSVPFNTPTNITLGLQGQGFAQTFTGNAGQSVSAAVVTSVSAIPSIYGTLSLISPTGVVLVTQTITGTCNGCNEYGVASFGPLPTTGTYTVLLQQGTTTPTTGSAGITVTQALAGTLTLGTTNAVTISAGQGFNETFPGSAGEYVSVGVSASSATAPTKGTLSILDPYGNVVGSSTYYGTCSGSSCSGSGVVSAGPLAATGNYTVVFQQTTSPYGVGSGAMSVTPTAAATGTLTAGTTANVTLLAGQGFDQSVAGTAGQYLSVALASSSNIPSGTISVLTPTGAVLATGSYTYSGGLGAGNVAFGPLPASGTYSVLFQQTDTNNVLGQGVVNVTAEDTASGTLTLGTPTTVSLVDGQGVQETFGETAGDYDTVLVSESNGLISAGTIWVISPGGTTISNHTFGYSCPSTCTGSTSFNIGPLPSTGTYTLLVQQADEGPSRGSGSLTLQVTNNPAGTGTTQSLQTTVAGQAATFTFLAAATQPFNLAFTGMTFTPNTVTSFSIAIKNSSGTTVYSNSCSSSSCSMSIPTSDIAADGTYTVSVTPNGSATMSGTAILSATAVGELTAGTPLNLTLATDQAASLLFSATANQTLALYISGISTTPSGGSYYVTVFNPSGAGIGTAVPSSATTINLPNLAAGTYTVNISAEGTYSGTMQVTLAAGVTGTLPLTGSGVNISTSTPGDTAYCTFAGTQQQGVTLAISNLTLTPSSVTSIALGLPTADALGSPGSTCPTAGCAFHLPYLPQTQNYSVSLTPAGEATMSLTATLSQDVTGTLAAGTPLNLSLSDPGQSAVLTFVLAAPGEDNTELYISNFSKNPTTSSYTLSIYEVLSSSAEYKPIRSVTLTSAAQAVNLSDLAPGTYIAAITPNSAAVASLQLTLYAPAGVSVPSGGSPVTVSTTGPGQNAYLTFQGNAGQYLSLPLTNFTLTPSTTTSLTATAYTPTGTQVGYVNCSVPSLGCELYVANLPVTDTYNVTIVPSSSPLDTMSFSVAEPAPVTGTLALSTPTNESLSVVGQIANLSFTTTATETVTVSIGSIATTPSGNSITAFVYNSSGTNVGPYYGSSGSATQPITITLTNLPAGTYSLVIYPQLPTTETMQVTVTP